MMFYGMMDPSCSDFSCMHEYTLSSLVSPVTFIARHNPTLSVEYRKGYHKSIANYNLLGMFVYGLYRTCSYF